MSELEELKVEVSRLRQQLEEAQSNTNELMEGFSQVIYDRLREREYADAVIWRYLDRLSSRKGRTKKQKAVGSFIPFWNFFHALRVLYEEPFSIWAEDEFERVAADENKRDEEIEKSWDELRKNFEFTFDDGQGGRKTVRPFDKK